MEYFDILNEDGRSAGYTASRDEAHEKGLWHKTVHVWLVNDKHELLLQKRAANIISHPNKWDISAAGHIKAGEGSLESALKETEEELGLKLSASDLKFLFPLKNQSVQNNKTYINNEFNDVYLARYNSNPKDLILDPKEVADVKFMPCMEVKEKMEVNGDTMVNHGAEVERLIPFLDK